MTYLQKVLDEIEAEAAAQSRAACLAADVLEEAYALRDRLVVAGASDDTHVCNHLHSWRTSFSIQTITHDEATLRAACQALGLPIGDGAGRYSVADNIDVCFYHPSTVLAEAA